MVCFFYLNASEEQEEIPCSRRNKGPIISFGGTTLINRKTGSLNYARNEGRRCTPRADAPGWVRQVSRRNLTPMIPSLKRSSCVLFPFIAYIVHFRIETLICQGFCGPPVWLILLVLLVNSVFSTHFGLLSFKGGANLVISPPLRVFLKIWVVSSLYFHHPKQYF